MIEFWAVVGLACLDHVFLRELLAHAPNIEKTVREYGFRLSRFEMGELKRILRIPRVVECMHNICSSGWEYALNDAKPCWWSAERSADHDEDLPATHKRGKTGAVHKRPNLYIHPLKNQPEVEKKDDGHVSTRV
jgi:hypothetical protein